MRLGSATRVLRKLGGTVGLAKRDTKIYAYSLLSFDTNCDAAVNTRDYAELAECFRCHGGHGPAWVCWVLCVWVRSPLPSVV